MTFINFWTEFFKGVASNGITVNITIDNSGRLITDVGNDSSVDGDLWTPKSFTLTGDTKIVTIKAHNEVGGPGGILASFSNKVLTDESWDCADMKGRHPFCSNGSSGPLWKPAVTYGRNDNASTIWYQFRGRKLDEIESNAQWIWVNDSTATEVWCRRMFGK